LSIAYCLAYCLLLVVLLAHCLLPNEKQWLSTLVLTSTFVPAFPFNLLAGKFIRIESLCAPKGFSVQSGSLSSMFNNDLMKKPGGLLKTF
jgi:hypothetical protein